MTNFSVYKKENGCAKLAGSFAKISERLNKTRNSFSTLPFEVFLSRFSRKTKDAFPLLKVSDYKIIQMLTAKLSRVSLQRYPDTDYTICLRTTGDNLPSRRHLSSSFGEMTNYPDIVTLSQTFRHPLLFTKVTKDQVVCYRNNERDTCGSRSALIGPKGVERPGSLSPQSW